jgi:hypothetical protein
MSRRRERSAERAIERQTNSIIATIMAEVEELGIAPDPLDIELVASGVTAIWRADLMDDAHVREAMGAAVLSKLALRPDQDVLALLLAIDTMATPPLDDVVDAAIGRLREARVPEPIWSRSIGRPVLVDAWISTDELDDQSNVLVAFAYEGRPPHAINAIVDANFKGLIRDLFVADDPAKVRREWIAVSGLPIRALSEQALADVLGQGVRMYDIYLDPPVAKEVDLLMPLLRSRLNLLPEPREVEPAEVPEELREELVADFSSSPEAADLGSDGGVDRAELARWFVDFACDYGAGDPLRWSPIALEILLTDWLPRKAVIEPERVAAILEVLKRWVSYCGRRKGLTVELLAENLTAVDAFTSDFTEGMIDEDRAGPAKQIALELQRAGVDLTDAAAVQRVIDAWNAAPDRGSRPPRWRD